MPGTLWDQTRSELPHDGQVRHAVVGTIGGDGRVGYNIADGAVTVLVWRLHEGSLVAKDWSCGDLA
jgi:hypothetical protein